MDSVQKCVTVCKRDQRVSKDDTKEWKFRVLLPDLHPSEVACVTGDCTELGDFQHPDVVPLKKEGSTNFWSAVVAIPSIFPVNYRYCVCIIAPNPRQVIVRKWETNFDPRRIKTEDLPNDETDTFGEYNQTKKIDNGWLSEGKLFQFTIPEGSIKFGKNLIDKTVYVKLTPLNSQLDCVAGGAALKEPDNVITEVANQNGEDPKFKYQEEYGHVYSKTDYLLFNVTTPTDVVNIFIVNFYEKSTEGLIHLGYTHILVSALKMSKGKLELPIYCATNNLPIGTMKGTYLIILPTKDLPNDMLVTYQSFWNELWKGLEGGHRGMGSSFKGREEHKLRENTIASFEQAVKSGADLVEFDVQLSKDLVPVIYHDFKGCLITKNKTEEELSDMVVFDVQDLTLKELQELRIYHQVEKREGIYVFDETIPEPFPLLSDVYGSVNPDAGFDIEIKWPISKANGEMELEKTIDLNIYLDKIIEVVMRHNRSRKIFFSCFDPDVCTALRMKQNLYRTMFLTEGLIDQKYEDSRCNSIPAAVKFALNSSIIGIVSQTADLFRDPDLVKLVRDAGLVHFCWGNDNNNKENINKLKGWGMEGIIFDKIDVYSTKPKKETVFKQVEMETSAKYVVQSN